MACKRPNIILIMDDQHRFDWLGCSGADWVSTPNIDALAARGTKFTHCVTNSPICAPARIALASGMRPQRLGALNNQASLPLNCTSYYQRLRDHGYHVACVGKLDLAKSLFHNGSAGERPQTYSWGFTHPFECEGKIHAGRFPTPQGPYGEYLLSRGLYADFQEDYARRQRNGWVADYADSALPPDAFEDVFIGDKAVEWIAGESGEYPYHLFVSFAGPHNPFDPPSTYADRYRNNVMPAPISRGTTARARQVDTRQSGLDDATVVAIRRQYAAAIELIDNQVGRCLQALEDKGVVENTIVIFASDHGEMLGDYGCFTKEFPYEPAIRVPLVIAGPGIPAQSTSNALVELIDVNATICELAGLERQNGIDARSLMSLLNSDSDDHRDHCISVLQQFNLIRTKTHKFVENVNDIAELYAIETDPLEQENLVEANRGLVQRLRQQLRRDVAASP